MPTKSKMLRTILKAAIVFFMDVVVLHFYVAMIAAIVIVIKYADTPQKDKELAKKRLIVYIIMFVLIIAAQVVNLKIAESRANMLVTKIEKYKQDHGAYPKKLEDLVPKYIDEVPSPYYLHTGWFRYYSPGGERGFLEYVVIEPFGRRIYWFRGHKWVFAD